MAQHYRPPTPPRGALNTPEQAGVRVSRQPDSLDGHQEFIPNVLFSYQKVNVTVKDLILSWSPLWVSHSTDPCPFSSQLKTSAKG